jgi:hypothetical protein
MSISIDELWSMSESALVGAYPDARRQFVEKKFARDTHRARLDWLRAKTFVTSAGGVTERKMAVDSSEELGRKGQELREMTRDLDLLKVHVDVIAAVMRLRGAPASAALQVEDATAARAGPRQGMNCPIPRLTPAWLQLPRAQGASRMTIERRATADESEHYCFVVTL